MGKVTIIRPEITEEEKKRGYEDINDLVNRIAKRHGRRVG